MASIVSVFITRAFRVGAVAFVRTMLTVSVRVAFTVSVTRRFWFMIRIVSTIFVSIATVIVGFGLVITLIGCIMSINDGALENL